MPPETDLAVLLATIRPARRPGRFVFVSLPPTEPVPPAALATVVEDEGRSVVLPEEDAIARGLRPAFVGAWITLRVQSALDAVGLTAAVSGALAEHGISANVIAGHHHDHLLVPADRADEAVAVLDALSASAESTTYGSRQSNGGPPSSTSA